ncbi:NADH dehydrogenase subunit C [Sulfurifustis variabilis]|uniref:NADH-quinone oxidoreductase subunit C n=1 Tax=Sulfurifustis variabilis TaxID=1675686 RepID=A0A1B4V6A3_9GAMM|nr:NADH-quinone oxidoreductase subunit C [Sulfurifustis variabilis]BAU48965.1 NADH dehydrogenase subunit C [Sulfurifustis variabilis]
MTDSLQPLAAHATEKLAGAVLKAIEARGELTLEVRREDILSACRLLRDDPAFRFEQLIDLCGIDYATYRAESPEGPRPGPRFAVVYHLLSLKHNRRLRLRAFLEDDFPRIDSVLDVWSAADWYEREAYDLYGIVFEGHPDLRRILTDYGFIGHPFRKDFPLVGHVEMRYDEEKQRVVYQPVTIENRVLVPRVIRDEGFARG